MLAGVLEDDYGSEPALYSARLSWPFGMGVPWILDGCPMDSRPGQVCTL